jgi:hypothetical protein
MKILKNTPYGHVPSIQVCEGDKEWDEAYTNWLQQKNPTKSPEWKKGVFFTIKESV